MNKTCNQCNISKNINLFYKEKKGKYGVEGKCKECRNLQKSEYYKQYYNKNKEKFKEYSREYFKTDIGKIVSINKTNRRRALIKNTTNGSCTSTSLKNLLVLQNYKCILCGKNITEHNSRHLDHIIPLSKGGQHIIENIQWLCIGCNLHKSNKV